jgi:hypothetical protein
MGSERFSSDRDAGHNRNVPRIPSYAVMDWPIDHQQWNECLSRLPLIRVGDANLGESRNAFCPHARLRIVSSSKRCHRNAASCRQFFISHASPRDKPRRAIDDNNINSEFLMRGILIRGTKSEASRMKGSATRKLRSIWSGSGFSTSVVLDSPGFRPRGRGAHRIDAIPS